MTSQAVLRVRNLYKIFGRRPEEAVKRLQAGKAAGPGTTSAVIDANFDVNRGEIFVVMGLSGSGKSTLIRMLNGLLPASAGQIQVGEREITKANAKQLRQIRREKVSMVFQHFALLPHRSVLANVAYGLEIQGMKREEREAKALEVINLVGLGEWVDAFPHELSGGMQQRVGIARALTADTEVLLMDEAFSALDPLIRREMQDQLIDLQRKLNKTIVFITHDLNEAMHLGDRIAVMRGGRIMQIGTPEEILTDPANEYVEQFVEDVDRARVLTAASVVKPARGVVQVTAGPRSALRAMRDDQTSAVFVVDRDRTLLGSVSDRAALALLREGRTTLVNHYSQDVAEVSADTLLADLVIPSLESPLPLAVVDDRHRLIGVIPRVVLLAAFAGGNGNTDEITIAHSPEQVPQATIDSALNGQTPTSEV